MTPYHPSKRRRREAQFSAEALESRSLLTGGAGNMFAIIPGEITTPGQAAAVKFTIDPTHFHLPKGSFTLGIDVAPDPASKLKPLISSVGDPAGKVVAQAFHSVYDPHIKNTQIAAGQATAAVLTPIHVNHGNPNAPVTYSVNVKGVQNTTGKFLLGFYLPGDVNGDGTVNQADLTALKPAMNSRSGGSKYLFDGDVNRDGRIGAIDMSYAEKNQGVSTTISPNVTANLDPADLSGSLQPRVVSKSTAHFTGTVTPGATVTLTPQGGTTGPATTTADASGNYSLVAPLGDGQNTFQITTMDGFGQSISGTLAPVTRIASAASSIAKKA